MKQTKPPSLYHAKGHFTHKPRVVTMKILEPKRKCPKAVPTHLQMSCSVVTDPQV